MTSTEKLNEFVRVYNDTAAHATVKHVAEALGLSVSRVKSKASEIRAMNREGSEVDEIVWRASKPAGSSVEIEMAEEELEPIEAVIARACAHNARYEASHEAKECVEVRIDESGWFGVAGPGDPHLNNPGTRLARAFEEAKVIRDTPGLYTIQIGDSLDNFIIGRLERARREDVVSNSQAWRIQQHYFETVAPKIIGGVFGNHDRWIEMLSGLNVLKMQLREMGIAGAFGSEQQRIRILTNEREFIHLIRHNFPGHSKYHPTHGILAWALERWQGEHAYWGGHIHCSGHMLIQRDWMGESRAVDLIQLHSYKKIDSYAREGGFRENQVLETPILLINAKTGEQFLVPEFKRGVMLLNALRSQG